LKDTCISYKLSLVQLDDKYSQLDLDFKNFKKYHRNCPLTKDMKMLTIERSTRRVRRRGIAKTKEELNELKNNMHILIENIRSLTYVGGNRITRATLSFKVCYKMVNDIFLARLDQIKKNPESENDELTDLFLPFFIKNFGVVAFAEKKLKQFLFNLFNYAGNAKIQVFMRLAGLSKTGILSKMYQRIYFEALEYMVENKEGVLIGEDLTKGKFWVPILRFKNYTKKYLSRRIDSEASKFLEGDIEHYKKTPPNSLENPEGIIEFDLIMLSVFSAMIMTKEKNTGNRFNKIRLL